MGRKLEKRVQCEEIQPSVYFKHGLLYLFATIHERPARGRSYLHDLKIILIVSPAKQTKPWVLQGAL